MKYEGINKRFTDTVAEWMAKGYHINTASMGGSQGEIAHLDLTDGKEIIRIVLESLTEWDEHMIYEGLELKVGRCTDCVTPDSGSTWGTVWNNRLEILSSERYYQIGCGKRNGEKWYGTREDAETQTRIHRQRIEANPRHQTERVQMPEAAKAAILPYLRSLPKCKSLKLSRIAAVEKVTNTNFDNSIHRYFEVTTVGGRTFKIG